MLVRPASPSDWMRFSELADTEGWLVPAVERELFASIWAGQALVLVDNEHFCGMVTAVVHERTGWIGNLIVPATLRGRGYGTQLFREALSILRSQHVSSVWLTASEMGRPLYEGFGFTSVQQVERWLLKRENVQVPDHVSVKPVSHNLIYDADLAVWNETRKDLLGVLVGQGPVLGNADSIALLQQGKDIQVIGPWYSKTDCPRTYRRLLQQILAAARFQKSDLVIDLCGPSALRPLLAAAGFARCGSALLMVNDNGKDVGLNEMVSLASLGSVG